MSEESNDVQAVAPQAAVMPANADTVNISPLMGAGMEYKSYGNKPGNGQGLTASGEVEKR